MLTNTLTQLIQLQQKTTTQTATGVTQTWKPVSNYYARVIPLDVKTVAYYQQLSTVVTHKVILRGAVTVSLGTHRLTHGAKTYEPAVSAQHLGNETVIIVREA